MGGKRCFLRRQRGCQREEEGSVWRGDNIGDYRGRHVGDRDQIGIQTWRPEESGDTC